MRAFTALHPDTCIVCVPHAVLVAYSHSAMQQVSILGPLSTEAAGFLNMHFPCFGGMASKQRQIQPDVGPTFTRERVRCLWSLRPTLPAF